jgi:POT family proton-dependent oligopeptide transporter
MIGFIFGALTFGILFLIPETPTEQQTIFYLLSLVALGISEIHIAPIIHSIFTKYCNPKYLAIVFSIAFIPTRILSVILGLFNEMFYENPYLGLKVGVILMSICSIGLIIFIIVKKNINATSRS